MVGVKLSGVPGGVLVGVGRCSAVARGQRLAVEQAQQPGLHLGPRGGIGQVSGDVLQLVGFGDHVIEFHVSVRILIYM